MQALVKEVNFFFPVFVYVQEVRRNVEETRRSIQVLSLLVQSTCFPGTKVETLTHEELLQDLERRYNLDRVAGSFRPRTLVA